METIKRLIGWFRRWEYSGLCLLVLIILVLHFSVIMQPNEPLFDEKHYVPDARLIIQGEGTERTEHPPLSKLFIVAGIHIFGDNPWGWRLLPVIFSVAGVVFFYLICRRLNLSKKVSYLATFLLALENMSFVQGSIAMLDVFSLTFTLAAFWLYLKGRYVMSGVAVGLSALAKLSGALAILVIGLHWLLTGGWSKVWHRWRLLIRFFTRHKHRRFFPILFICNWWLGIISFSLAICGVLALLKLDFSSYSSTGFISHISTLIYNLGSGIIGNDYGLIGILRILGLVLLGVILIDPRQWHFLLWFLSGRRHRWRFLLWFSNRWRSLLLILSAPITFITLMPFLDFAIWHKWLNPITQIHTMLDRTGSIVFSGVDPGTGSRPWEWIFTYPDAIDVMPYWWEPTYTGMISATIWLFIIPIVIYITWRALKGNIHVLLPFAWFVGLYLVWIPAILITDRVTYLFYIYPTIGAIAIGLSIVIYQLLDIAEARQKGKLKWAIKIGVSFYLLLHIIAFVIISPCAPLSLVLLDPPYFIYTLSSLWWSIPLYLLLYIFSLRFLGIIKWPRFGNSIASPENQVDMPPEQ